MSIALETVTTVTAFPFPGHAVVASSNGLGSIGDELSCNVTTIDDLEDLATAIREVIKGATGRDIYGETVCAETVTGRAL